MAACRAPPPGLHLPLITKASDKAPGTQRTKTVLLSCAEAPTAKSSSSSAAHGRALDRIPRPAMVSRLIN